MRGFYLEKNQPHYLLWPVLAFGNERDFWIGIGFLNFEFGWRSGVEK